VCKENHPAFDLQEKAAIKKHRFKHNFLCFPMLWIRIGFNAEPDPAFFVNADSDADPDTDPDTGF
jgi:hypothetical protein